MPQVGDIIKYPRYSINHYAIYIGNGEIIHRTTAGEAGSSARPNSFSSGSGAVLDKAIVKKHRLEDPAEKYGWRVDNYYDTKYQPLSPERIVENATSQLGNAGYNILFQNCEHFVTWCRYGEAKISREVTHKAAGVGLCTMPAAGGGVTVGIAAGTAAASSLATATGIAATVGAALGPIGIGIGAGVGAGITFFATAFGFIGCKIKP